MKAFRVTTLLFGLSAIITATSAAEAAPRLLFKGCAYLSMLPPGCLKMKATDGKTYQLLDVPPSFAAGTPAFVYANPGAEIGLCFAPTARMIGFKPMPGKC
jgi:hypothetical protein